MTTIDQSIHVAPAIQADVPDILRCIQGLAEFERLAGACVATEALLRETLFGPDPAAEVLLARQGDETLGFALWYRNYSTFLARPGIHLEDLFVFPAWRGRGLGTRLLSELAHLAVARGYGRLEWAVLDWNADAIRFYHAHGATPMADWTTFRVTGAALEALGSNAPHSPDPTEFRAPEG